MCGISGMFLFDKQVDPGELTAMGATLEHRGPDHFSTVIVDNIGFAHNRLSIVDISSAGDQPFHDEEHFLIFNGEIYNHNVLRQDLLKKGIPFKGTSDTETLFEYIKAYGVKATLLKIKGMFAFAYYDHNNRQLFLCRDRYGIKPLFWTCNNRGLFWASEVKALMVSPGVKVDPIRALFSITGTADQSNKCTIFENVFHVPPGNYLVIDAAHQPVITEYYSVLNDVDENYYRELENAPGQVVLQTFESLLSASVEKMLMSDVPVGVFVSGGIDSSLIAALACRYDPSITLFTSDVVGKLSELPYSQLLSRTLGAQLNVNPFQPEQFLADLTAATFHYEVPIVKFANAIAFGRVAELAQTHNVKPVLTGEGSDEIFLGYPALHYKKYEKYLEFPKNAINKFYGFLPIIKNYQKKSETQNLNDFLQIFTAGFERQFMRERSGLTAYHFIGNNNQIKDNYQAIQMLREHLIALLHRNDRMGMQYSIESRFPFLDEEVVKFGVNLPLKWKIKSVGNIFDRKHPFVMDKAIVRLLAQKLLPKELANKPKWGFGINGHQNMKVNSSFFKQGYIANLIKLDDAILDYMVETQDRNIVAKLACLEIFGRLFDWRSSVAEVNDRVLHHIQMEVNL